MKLKIFHILDSLNIGGLENGVVNLINRLDAERFDHIICCLRSVGPMAQRIKRPDVTILCLNQNGRDYTMPLKLKKKIIQVKPDIVHTRNWGTIDGVIAAKLAGVRTILHGEHGRDFSDMNGKSLKHNIGRKVLSIFINRFIAVSEDIKHWLVNECGIKGGKIRKIINGVDTTQYKPGFDKKKEKEMLGFDPEVLIIGAVGRLDKIKNYQMLLRAMQVIQKKKYPVLSVFIGDGPERALLEAFANELNIHNVRFMGQKNDVHSYFKIFDLFALTSFSEGISNTILESLASGVPVIATDVGGNKELVKDNVNGFLIPSDNHICLEKKIECLLKDENLRSSFSLKARSLCEKEFSLEQMVKEYDSLYSSYK